MSVKVKIFNSNKVHFDDLLGGSFFIADDKLYMKNGNGNTGLAICLENDGNAGTATRMHQGLDVTPVKSVSIDVTI